MRQSAPTPGHYADAHQDLLERSLSRQMGRESAHDGAPCQPRRQPRIPPTSRPHVRVGAYTIQNGRVFSQKLGIISYLSYTVSYQRWYEIFDCFSLMPDSPQSRGSLYPICFASHRALSQLTSPCDHSNLTRPLHTCCGYLLGSAARQPISIAVPVTSCCNPVTSCSS